jgi:hypothetical protein
VGVLSQLVRVSRSHLIISFYSYFTGGLKTSTTGLDPSLKLNPFNAAELTLGAAFDAMTRKAPIPSSGKCPVIAPYDL